LNLLFEESISLPSKKIRDSFPLATLRGLLDEFKERWLGGKGI